MTKTTETGTRSPSPLTRVLNPFLRVLKTSAVVMMITAGVAVVTACSSIEEPSQSNSPDSSPSSSPVPSPASPEKPALNQLVLTADGMGTLRLGHAPPEDDPDTDILVLVPGQPSCPEQDPDYRGEWVANYPSPDEQPFRASVQEEVVTAIVVRSPEISSEAGIRVGSSVDDLLAAYPLGFDASNEGAESVVYVVQGTYGSLAYEVPRVGIGWGDVENTVLSMFSVTADPSEVQPISGTDAFGGAYC